MQTKKQWKYCCLDFFKKFGLLMVKIYVLFLFWKKKWQSFDNLYQYFHIIIYYYYYFHHIFLLFSLLYFDILCISIFINNTFSFLTTCDMCNYADDSTLYTYSRDFHQFQKYDGSMTFIWPLKVQYDIYMVLEGTDMQIEKALINDH